MAKPKGGTLSALFEVSEQERQAFYDHIQKRIHPEEKTGAPLSGTPETGIPDSGVPVINKYTEALPLVPEQHPEIIKSGIPVSGVPERATPNMGVPLINEYPKALPATRNKHLGVVESGIPETGIPAPGRHEIGIPDSGAPKTGTPLLRSLRIRRATNVQDGHSLGEHLILTTLWNQAVAVEGQTYRRIAIGYRTLSGFCGLTVNNCKANLKSLQAKLAIEPETTHSTTSATTYRVYSFAEILRRRETAGLTHVLRNRGAMFVHPETGIPVSAKGIPETGIKGIPETGTLLRSKKEKELKENPSSDILVVSAAIAKHLIVDDDVVQHIIEGCRRNVPSCTSDEIAEFAALSAAKISRQKNVDNPAGLLISQVPRFFPGVELTAYRSRKAKELADRRELAQRILDDPEAGQQEREWAKTVIPDVRRANN